MTNPSRRTLHGRFLKRYDVPVWASLAMSVAMIAAPVLADDNDARITLGQQLFEKDWQPLQGPGGDGLGPAFNDHSCVACHRQGGVGGGGPIDKNVDILSLPNEDIELTFNQARKLRQLHPGFVSAEGDMSSTIVLHKFGLEKNYAALRRQLIGDEPAVDPHPAHLERAQHQLAASPLKAVATSFDIGLVRAQRNSSALFGSGLIDQVPEEVLLALETQQPAMFPGITGRAAPAPGGIGRFGWRARTARLSEFVLQACANEIGLQVTGNAQGVIPTKPDYVAPGLDMTPAESTALVAFVTALPPPRQVLPTDPDKARLVQSGQDLFSQVGCVACHLTKLGPVDGLYSDLLLHDMGPALADPAPALADSALLVERKLPPNTAAPTKAQTRTQVIVPVKQSMATAGQSARNGKQVTAETMTQHYYGGSMVTSFTSNSSTDRVKVLKQPTNVYQEWRTPPLWGVQDSAPYLHDGRAATLVEAIAWHGGEALPSAQRFFKLPVSERQMLLAFLRSLRAPAL